MHILVHDYAGHPFTAELSRTLAARGWRVTHAFFDSDGGPKGRNARLEGDAPGLAFAPLDIAQAYSKTNFFKRRQGDVAYGRKIATLIEQLRPDIVLSGNTPTETQEFLERACTKTGASFIYWCQDFYSIAASRILSKKLPLVGAAVGAYYTYLERRQMHRAAHIIHITDAFCPVTEKWGIAKDKISVVPNWGVIDEIPQLERTTDWAAAQGLSRASRVVYSGTLANKHNPELLAALSAATTQQTDVVVVGFGPGADALAARQAQIPNLKVLPLQPFKDLPQVLASADVLVAVIEADAGAFSVPSKVLSYLCAGRPIVLAAPASNLAAQILVESGAGTVVAPDDISGFVAAVQSYLDDPDARRRAGEGGRAYAEAYFRLDAVADRFETIFNALRPAAFSKMRQGAAPTEPLQNSVPVS